ncbi:MAG TPA: CoA transferase [Acidimicrobiia bacterium]|jgi:crotonobetainyl-CoA:carnitine CoA-transferase CaiB-like acyl-CoA transferase
MLTGVTVLELGQVIAGTYGGAILAELGAEVIKIEPPRGDTARNAKIAPLMGESAIHLFMNRGKKSVVIDLKSDEGRDVFYRLVETADVVVDNFRPGVMKRLGIDHEALKRRNPDIITVSVTGFGETGPLRDKAAFDLVVQAFSGHMDITGDPDGPPARVGIPIADIAGGIFSCISVLAALAERGLGGQTRHADVSMLDSLVSMLSYDALDHLNSGRPVTRHGTAHAHMVPWQAFETSDGYVVVAARDEKFWRNLCVALGRPELLDDERFKNNAARVANRDVIVPILTEAFKARPKAEWAAILDEHDIPAAPVNDVGDVFTHPHVLERDMVHTYDHPTLGPIKYPPSPVKFSGWAMPADPAPMLGEHSRAVLEDRLGMEPSVVARLIADGTIGTWVSDE